MVTNQLKGLEQLGQNAATQMLIGYHEYELLDASAGDASATTVLNCRFIKVDTAGIVKIDYVKENGDTVTEVLYLASGELHAVRNVKKLYQYYASQTAGTAKCYSSAGATVTNAVKLCR